jgi:predicted MFS family arabinose efflux permease
MMVMVTGVAATLGGLFTEHFGYAAVFATAALLTLFALAPAALSFRGGRLQPAGRHAIS